MTVTRERVQEIREEFSQREWPRLYYFVHCEAKEHIGDLLEYITELERRAPLS